MKRSWLIWEIVAWTVFFPVALVLARAPHARLRRRVARRRAWRRCCAGIPRRGASTTASELGELLRDTIEDDRDGLRVSLDVAREGTIERDARRSTRARAVAAAMLTVGWIAVLPQGIVAAVFLAVDGPQLVVPRAVLREPDVVARDRGDDRRRPRADRPLALRLEPPPGREQPDAPADRHRGDRGGDAERQPDRACRCAEEAVADGVDQVVDRVGARDLLPRRGQARDASRRRRRGTTAAGSRGSSRTRCGPTTRRRCRPRRRTSRTARAAGRSPRRARAARGSARR